MCLAKLTGMEVQFRRRDYPRAETLQMKFSPRGILLCVSIGVWFGRLWDNFVEWTKFSSDSSESTGLFLREIISALNGARKLRSHPVFAQCPKWNNIKESIERKLQVVTGSGKKKKKKKKKKYSALI
eukprot:Trichotokara_eunicae@DN1366_c0_g1_i2.p1